MLITILHLNTSYVKVQQVTHFQILKKLLHLNTSYVKVQHQNLLLINF